MWNFRTFYDDDRGELSIAHGWYLRTPSFVRSISTFLDEREEFIKELSGTENYSGIIGNEIKGVVHGEQKTIEIVEGHLFCSNDVDIDFVTALVIYSKSQALKTYKIVLTTVLTKHKFLHEVMKRAGFIDTKMRAIQGVHKGKLMEVIYYTSEGQQ